MTESKSTWPNFKWSVRAICLVPILIAMISPAPALAWWEHTLLTYAATDSMPSLSRKVQVESLESFLRAEGPGLQQALIAMEEEFKSIPSYPGMPSALTFDPAAQDIRLAFLKAIRINQKTRLLNYAQYVPGHVPASCKSVPYRQITFLQEVDYLKGVPFCETAPGTAISARDVLVSASDEPDYGHDIALFEDNEGPEAENYGFGIQPFGNPSLEYSSQAPFHMGFYHESAMIYALAGFLKRTFAQYRALQYLRLAQFAFKTGHDYWGYRFLGWGLHYVQDLTQPYHATVMPSRSSAGMIWINLLNTVGMSGPQSNAVQLLTNRHLALENFQRNLMLHDYRNGAETRPAFQALADDSHDAEYDYKEPGYIRSIIAGESASAASDLDSLLEEALPETVAHDPEYTYEGVEPEEDMFEQLKKNGKAEALSQKLLPLFRSVGIHTRNYIRLGRNQ